MNVKFTDLIFDVIVEEVKNKALLNACAVKWYGENPTPEEIRDTEKLIEWHASVKSDLNPNTLEVAIFLNMTGFEPKFLPDISKYTLQQINILHDEFVEPANQQEDDAFAVAKKAKYNDKAGAASKKLWLSSSDAVIDEEGFKVHYVPDQKTAVRYGYYCQYVQKFINLPKNMVWCVTGRGGDSGTYQNMWKNYRDGHKRTFWFVLDESKNPETHPELDPSIAKYYLGALQYENSHSNKTWRITSVLNDGDTAMEWSKVIQIYPQLANLDTNSDEFKQKFAWTPYSNVEDDTATRGELSDITEREGDPGEFCLQNIRLKKGWIVDLQPLNQPKSWKFLNSYLRNLYIQLTDEGNMFNRWKSDKFLFAVKETPAYWNLLKNKMEDICDRSQDASLHGHSVDILFKKIMEGRYKTLHESIENNKLSIVKSDETQKIGIFNYDLNEWYKNEGITYDPKYKEISTDVILLNDGSRFLSFCFSESPTEMTETSFFAFHPSHLKNKNAKAHLISYKEYKLLEEKFIKNNTDNDTDDYDDDDDHIKLPEFDPNQSADIKEEI